MMNAKGINNGVTVNNIVTVKVPVGIPASGKSTWAATQVAEGCVIHSSDAIRAELKLGYAKEDHQKVFSTMRERTIASLKRGQSVVYDATNISEWARSEVYKTVKAVRRLTNINVEIEIYYFDTPVDVCIERNSHREGAACVPVDCINRMAANIVPPTEEELLRNGVADIAIIETVKYEKEDKTMKKTAEVKNVTVEDVVVKEDVVMNKKVLLTQISQATIDICANKASSLFEAATLALATSDWYLTGGRTKVYESDVEAVVSEVLSSHTKDMLRERLEDRGINLSNTEFKKTLKKDLIARVFEAEKATLATNENDNNDGSNGTIPAGDFSVDNTPSNIEELGGKQKTKQELLEEVMKETMKAFKENTFFAEGATYIGKDGKEYQKSPLFFKANKGSFKGNFIATRKRLFGTVASVLRNTPWYMVGRTEVCNADIVSVMQEACREGYFCVSIKKNGFKSWYMEDDQFKKLAAFN